MASRHWVTGARRSETGSDKARNVHDVTPAVLVVPPALCKTAIDSAVK
jgi:hypothetical protein